MKIKYVSPYKSPEEAFKIVETLSSEIDALKQKVRKLGGKSTEAFFIQDGKVLSMVQE